jgi:hypothetical protein
MGSLNALELAAHSSFFRRWLGQSVCSVDSVGRVTALVDAEGLRRGIHHLYDRLKRNKALPDQGGLGVAVLDGMKAMPATAATVRGAWSAPSAPARRNVPSITTAR